MKVQGSEIAISPDLDFLAVKGQNPTVVKIFNNVGDFLEHFG